MTDEPKIGQASNKSAIKRPTGKERPKPWEDAWGNPLPTEEIKKLSRRWTLEDWEEYLQSLEGNLKEKLGLKLDVKSRVELFASRGDEEFQKNAEQDLAEAHSMEAEQTHYLKPILLKDEDAITKEFQEAETEQEKKAALVRYSLQFLTASERFVIEKYFWDGMSEAKIAKAMQKSRSSVQTWKNRALTKIYEKLSSILPISEGLAPSESISVLSGLNSKTVLIKEKATAKSSALANNGFPAH